MASEKLLTVQGNSMDTFSRGAAVFGRCADMHPPTRPGPAFVFVSDFRGAGRWRLFCVSAAVARGRPAWRPCLPPLVLSNGGDGRPRRGRSRPEGAHGWAGGAPRRSLASRRPLAAGGPLLLMFAKMFGQRLCARPAGTDRVLGSRSRAFAGPARPISRRDGCRPRAATAQFDGGPHPVLVSRPLRPRLFPFLRRVSSGGRTSAGGLTIGGRVDAGGGDGATGAARRRRLAEASRRACSSRLPVRSGRFVRTGILPDRLRPGQCNLLGETPGPPVAVWGPGGVRRPAACRPSRCS